MTTIFEVIMEKTFSDGDSSYNTFVFTSKEKAVECVDYLYQHRFDETEDWHKNPFSECEETPNIHTRCTKTNAYNGKSSVVEFSMYDQFDCTNLSVDIYEKELDLSSNEWHF